MFILDSMLVGGLRFVLDKVARAVDEELQSPDRLREELLAAQMEHELGEISDEEFEQIEKEILARMRELRGETGGGPISFGSGDAGVDIDFDAGPAADGESGSGS